jgi:hypothetical protein
MKFYSNLLTYKLKIVRVAEMLDGASRVADCNQLQFAYASDICRAIATASMASINKIAFKGWGSEG